MPRPLLARKSPLPFQTIARAFLLAARESASALKRRDMAADCRRHDRDLLDMYRFGLPLAQVTFMLSNMLRSVRVLAVTAFAVALLGTTVSAQYFGRNKVQ